MVAHGDLRRTHPSLHVARGRGTARASSGPDRIPSPPFHVVLPDPVNFLHRDTSALIFGFSCSGFSGYSSDNPLRPELPELEAAVHAAIFDLGGAVLPKLDWSAPKDAVFMSTHISTR